MFKVQVLDKISHTGLNQFPNELYEVSTDIQSPDIILVRSKNMHDYSIPTSVKAIGRAGAGVNTIPVNELTKRGIVVFNTPGANANAVRELVLAGMLMTSRHLNDGWQYVKDLKIDSDENLNEAIEKHKKQYVGNELSGKTLGVIGLGSIGVKVANAAIHLGMRVIGYDPSISLRNAWELSPNVVEAHHLEDILKKSDYVTLHVPLLDATKNLINASRLKLMKENSVLLNFSREGIIDNHTVLEALNAKKLRSYVSDFPSLILKNHPSVIFFPHLGASTKEAEENCAVMIVKEIRDYLEFGAISYAVNFPTVNASERYEGTRIAIVNANVPSMVAQISSKLAEKKMNILSLINQSRDDIAYTLLDVEEKVNAHLISEIADIEGVLQVRKLG